MAKIFRVYTGSKIKRRDIRFRSVSKFHKSPPVRRGKDRMKEEGRERERGGRRFQQDRSKHPVEQDLVRVEDRRDDFSA